MITKLTTYVTDSINPYHNLALEEYLTFHTEPGECILFLWQNQNTVVIGKNQNSWKECKIKELERDGGHLARRLSGGGAVYHDLGNLNFTFCVRKEDYDVDRQLSVIIEAVRLLGLNAQKTGRNDIAVDGKKFSGNAFYDSKGFCYHHGTLLVQVDKEKLSRYLNVSREKLQSKGVDSVRSRVANLTDFEPGIQMEQVKEKLLEAFGEVYEGNTRPMESERLDWKEIRKSEQRFASWEWKYGRRIPFQYEISRRFSWGDVQLQFQVDGGVIQCVNAFSDGMHAEFVAGLPDLWKGVRYEESALLQALAKASVDSELAQQMKEDVRQLIVEKL